MNNDLPREMKADKSELFLMLKSDKAELVRELKSNKAELIDAIDTGQRQVRAWIIGAAAVHLVLTILFDIFFGKG